jgi:hypothetical protein
MNYVLAYMLMQNVCVHSFVKQLEDMLTSLYLLFFQKFLHKNTVKHSVMNIFFVLTITVKSTKLNPSYIL